MESTLNPTRSTRFVIDSRDRDLTRFPVPSHYEITLDEAVHDVVSMQLVVADVPFASYLVSAANNAIRVKLSNGTVISAIIPTGDYLATDLATAVLTALQSASPSSQTKFGSNYSILTDNISVSCNTAFSLVFSAVGSVALELGYPIGSTNPSVVLNPAPASGLSNIVNPPFRRNQHLNQSVVLKILPATVVTSINQNVNQSFALITPNRNALSAAGIELPHKTFNPPIARLARVNVDFSNSDGTPVDFQNHDNRIELLLTSLRAAKYRRFEGLATS